MIKKLFFAVSILILNTPIYASSPVIEKPKHNEEYLDKKINEFDAKLSETLHIPIKKFSSILSDIADYIYREEFTPIHKEIKLLQGEVAQLKRDLNEANKNILTLTKQVESLGRANNQGKIKIPFK